MAPHRFLYPQYADTQGKEPRDSKLWMGRKRTFEAISYLYLQKKQMRQLNHMERLHRGKQEAEEEEDINRTI